MATANRYSTLPGQIVGYQYQADQYCPDCLNREMTPTGHNAVTMLPMEEVLDRLADAAGIDRTDEWSFDSDDFPKVILAVQIGGSDRDRCGRCGEVMGR